MLIEVKVSGFDSMPIREVTMMSQKMAGLLWQILREGVLGGFECWAGLYWTILLELG